MLVPDTERGITEHLLPRSAELTERVAWFIRLRWVAVAGILLAVPAGTRLLGFAEMAAGRILALAACLFALNCAYVLAARLLHNRVRSDGTPDLRTVDLFAKTQIVLDLLILTAILHYSGGVQNPFSFFYIFHVVIASILLSRRSAYAVAALCVALFGSMVLLEELGSLPRYPIAPQTADYSPGYVATVVAATASTLFIAVFMATSIMARLRQKEDELEHAWRAVKQLEATKSRFLRLVSHEMRSPIVAIQSILDAVRVTGGQCLGEKNSEMLTRAGERAESLLHLTKDLLTLSRQQSLEPGHEQLGTVEMLEVTRNCVGLFRAQADERGVVVNEEYPAAAFSVRGDAESLGLVVSNLLSNAIRYTPAGGTVSISWRLDKPFAVLTVADTGIGIPEADMKHVFKEFFRADNARRFTGSGTGLGLAITRNIVERSGGSIVVESRESTGTTFTVTLPVAA